MDNAARARVLIVDEHPVTRWGLTHFLETRRNLNVVGEAGSAVEARRQIRLLEPDVVIMDIVLPDADGISFVREIAIAGRRKVLAFSAADTWDRVDKFIQSGGLGFVTKRCAPDELILALEAVCNNRRWISPSLRSATTGAQSSSKRRDLALSPREQEVAALVARGLTSRQIADQLCVSLKTIETHRYRIFRELQITSRAQLVSYALQNGLLRDFAMQDGE